MTTRHEGYIVILEKEIREDSSRVEEIKTALKMVKGIIDVKPIEADANSHCAYVRGVNETKSKFLQAISTAMKEDRNG